MDANSQTRGGRAAGRPIGAPNYNNNILIEVVERYLPQGLEAWKAVALAYQRESMEAVLRRKEDLRDNWNKKLCNHMGGGEKTKNSTNRKRGFISKAMDRMAESIESGGGGTVGVI